MSKILLKDWAIKHGISPDTATQKARRGKLPAEKIGVQWFIDPEAPNPDHRIKSGKYIKNQGTGKN